MENERKVSTRHVSEKLLALAIFLIKAKNQKFAFNRVFLPSMSESAGLMSGVFDDDYHMWFHQHQCVVDISVYTLDFD